MYSFDEFHGDIFGGVHSYGGDKTCLPYTGDEHIYS